MTAAGTRLAEPGLLARLVDDGTGAAIGTVSCVDPGGCVAVLDEVFVHVVPTPAPADEGGKGWGDG